MAPYHILIVIISSAIPENLLVLTNSEQSGPKSAHIRPTISSRTTTKFNNNYMSSENDISITKTQLKFSFKHCVVKQRHKSSRTTI